MPQTLTTPTTGKISYIDLRRVFGYRGGFSLSNFWLGGDAPNTGSNVGKLILPGNTISLSDLHGITSFAQTLGNATQLDGKTCISGQGWSGESGCINRTGNIMRWGGIGYGNYGNAPTNYYRVPTEITPTTAPSKTKWVGIAFGHYHTVYSDAGGIVYTVGINTFGGLGNGMTSSNTTSALYQVPLGTSVKVIAVCAGYYHTAVLTEARSVYTWGLNSSGQIGNGTRSNIAVPYLVHIPGSPVISGLSASYVNTAAVTNDGSVWIWGDNANGQLGDGTTTPFTTPKLITGLPPIKGFSVGGDGDGGHCLAVTTTGALYTWGDNSRGQLGNGTTTRRLTPDVVTFSNIEGTVASVSCAPYLLL